MKVDFLLIGVGGQGTLLASDVLAEVGLAAGYEVKKSEVHGEAQRGGSVVSHVRWGEQVHSPLIGLGEADYFLAFEKLEALRHVESLRPGGVVIVEDHAIPPVAVSSGDMAYPDDERVRRVLGEVAGESGSCHVIPALEIAEELGNARVHNIVLLGVLSALLDVPEGTWLEVIAEKVPPQYVELNRLAFRRGREALQTQ